MTEIEGRERRGRRAKELAHHHAHTSRTLGGDCGGDVDGEDHLLGGLRYYVERRPVLADGNAGVEVGAADPV